MSSKSKIFKIVELIIDPNDEQSGIDAISLVADPAIQSGFIALSKQKTQTPVSYTHLTLPTKA